jgi:RNA polymerase sigma factor (sigma-70 family)
VGTSFSTIDRLAERLPFRIDDSDAVNKLYDETRRNPDPRRLELIEIWTYCYIWRYFLWKHVQNESSSVGEFEASVSEAFRRAWMGKDRVSVSYASWISVVCRNTFLTYARRLNTVTALDDRTTELLQSEVPVREHDPEMLRWAIAEAIERLPAHLCECARLHFLENLDYDEMARLTGRSPATLRAYVHKSLKKLREDPWLKEFRDYMNDEFFSE